MSFHPGDEVHVPGLGTGVIREARKGGRFVVQIKGRSLLVDATLLKAVERPRRRTKPSPSTVVESEALPPDAPASIDLHGLTPDAAIAALDVFVNDAILAGHGRVAVIHGRGAGRLKDLVHRRLSGIGAVRHVRLDPANAGVTIVTL